MIILGLAMATGIAGLAPGVTLRLPAKSYDLLEISGEHYDPPVTIRADGASIAGLRIVDSSGINWSGGTISAPEGSAGRGAGTYAVDVRHVQGLSFENMIFTRAARGLVVADSRDVKVRNSHFTGLRSDGIDVAGVSQILFENNVFDSFSPIKPTGRKGDPDWKDGDHPDAIQIWTTPQTRSASDIIIRRNKISGDTQGINFFGPRGDGYQRVTIEDNDISILYPAGISMFACTDCTVRGNRLNQAKGAQYKVNLRFEASTGKACGNLLSSVPRHPANAAC